jgi:hypothetical protein
MPGVGRGTGLAHRVLPLLLVGYRYRLRVE